jgi:hypothetical protein
MSFIYAGEIDILLDKLVEKGVLSQAEALKIKTETQEQVRTEVEKGDSIYAKAIPEWTKNIKLKGDLRVRYEHKKETDSADRDRGRIRMRLGADTKINENIKIGLGLATGGSDPRSTNETFDNTFETSDIRLNYAYAEHTPFNNFSWWAGKYNGIKNAIWRPSDLLWDSDINPEGVGLKYKKNYKEKNIELFTNTGFWMLDESSSDSSDPFMYVIQPGIKKKFNTGVYFKTALAYYGFDNVKGSALSYSEGTNTLENSVLKYDYNAFAPSMEIGINEPFNGKLKNIALFGDYIHNDNPSDNQNGYLTGIKFAGNFLDKKWQLKYMYRRLEKDAWLDTFPDSDAFDGKTDVKGHEIALEYNLAKGWSAGLDYYFSERINSPEEQQLLQFDLMYKF